MTSELTEQVVDMIAEQTRCDRSKLRPEADLFRYLGVDGADAEDLLLRLSEAFEINLGAMQFDRQFGPEASNALALLLPSWWPWHHEPVPVTIADLVETARTRTWPIRYSDRPTA